MRRFRARQGRVSELGEGMAEALPFKIGTFLRHLPFALIACACPAPLQAQDDGESEGGIELAREEGLIAISGPDYVSITRNSLKYHPCLESHSVAVSYPVQSFVESPQMLEVTVQAEGRSSKLQLQRTATTLKGVQISEYTLAGEIPGIPLRGPLVFRQPQDPQQAVSFYPWSYCANMGYAPGNLAVLFDPGRKQDFIAWARRAAGDGLIEAATEASPSPVHFVEETSNAGYVDVVLGSETDVMTALQAQPWVIDFTMSPFPMGLSAVMFDLPSNTLDVTQANRTVRAQELTRRLLRTAFPQLAQSEYSVAIERGTRFTASAFAPARKFGLGSAFNAYWLRVKIDFGYYGSGRPGAALTRGYFVVQDGWLPKWGRPGTPPVDHTNQARLDENGAGQFRNFSSLNVVRERLNQAFVRVGGTMTD